MTKLEEKDFIKGNSEEIADALLIGEDVNSYIDSVIDKIYELDLTKEDEATLGIVVHREKSDDSWKKVIFQFGPGNDIEIQKRTRKDGNGIYRESHNISYRGQNASERAISAMTGFGFVGSHYLFTYDESMEHLYFDQGTERSIRISDEGGVTHYTKLGVTKKHEYTSVYPSYTYKYLDRDSYKEVRDYSTGKRTYVDLEGKELTQPELVATSYPSFENAFNSFNELFDECRNLVDARVEEIIARKSK